MSPRRRNITTAHDATKPMEGKHLLAIVLIGIAGVLISLLLYATLYRAEKRLARGQFKQQAMDRIRRIASEFESGMAIVHSVSADVRTSAGVNEDHFRSFAKYLLSQETTIHALGWNTPISGEELREHVLAARERQPDYTLTEMNPNGEVVEIDLDRDTSNSRDLVVVNYIEPFEANRSAAGFDIASEPTRREALNRARDTGKLAASGGITLVQETGNQYGVLVMAPIYENGVKLDSVEQRRLHFEGVVVGVFRIGSTVEAAIGNLQTAGIDVYLFDESPSSEPQLLHVHSSRSRGESSAPIVELQLLRTRAICKSLTFDMAGRRWTLCCTPTGDFLASRRTWLPPTVLGGGLVGTLALVAYLSHLGKLTRQLRHHIAEREETERSLKIAQHSIDSSHFPIFWVGPDSRFRFVNRAAAASLGYDTHEMYKMGVADIAPTWSSEEWPTRWARLKEARSATFESLHQRKDGTTYPVEIMVNHFSYAEQEYMFCLAMDITERKEQQNRIQEQERILTHVSRLSTLGEMVAGIAHEINQPLSAISSFAEACSKGLSASKSKFDLPLEDWSNQIGEQAVRCGDIIKRLRNFVKRNEAEWECVDLNQAVNDSISLVSNDARNRSIHICREPIETNLFVSGNQVQLQQVIVNLLRNAYEAVSDSDDADGKVCVRSHRSRDSIQLTVEDHGPGIDAVHREKVFDAFFTTKEHGMGMGLAISRSIIEAHGGRLWVEAMEHRGARFRVELPCVEESLCRA